MKNLLIIAGLSGAILTGCGAPATNETASNPAPDNAATNAVEPTTSAPIDVAELRKTKAFVRGVHVVPGIGPVTLKLDDVKLDQPFDVATASSFVAVTPEKNLKITAIGTGNNVVSGPMPVELKAGEDLTVVVNGVSGDVALLPLKSESGGPDADGAKLSILHAAKGLNALKIEIDGKPFRGDVDYGEDTDYKTLAPGSHTLKISYSQQVSGDANTDADFGAAPNFAAADAAASARTNHAQCAAQCCGGQSLFGDCVLRFTEVAAAESAGRPLR